MNQLVSGNAGDSTFVTLEGGHGGLSPEVIRNSILGLEKAMCGLPDEAKMGLETMHSFAPGTYTRTVFMKAGSLVVGKIHKQEHTVIISQGAASVVSEDTGSRHLRAPLVFVSPPKVKRLLFIHEDMIFSTIHQNPTNTHDLALLEEELVLKDYAGVK